MLVKCQWCEIKDTDRKEMEVEVIQQKKPVNKYYHKHCWKKYQERKSIIAKEMPLKDELNEVIKQIYGVEELPNQAWIMLENLRAGNPVFKKQTIGKRYRQGYEYPLIKATFEHCSETIEYWNGVKNFDGFMGAFRYAMSIIIDKIYVVEQRLEDQKRQQMMIEKHVEKVAEPEEFVSAYKEKKKDSGDFTDFLDD